MNIRNRLFMSALISIILVMIFIPVTLVTSNKIAGKHKEEDRADNVHLSISELNIITYEYLFYHEKRMEQQWYLKYHATAKAVGEELAKLIEVNYTTLDDLFSQIIASYEERVKLIQEGASQEKIDTTLLLEERLAAQLLIKSQAIITDASRLAQEAHTEAMEAEVLYRSLASVLMIVLVVAVATTSLLIARSISKPLAKLLKGAEIVGKGNLEHRIDIESQDEMGQLAVSFNEMTGKLQKSYTNLKKEVAQRKTAAQEIRGLNQELEQRLEELGTANKELEAFSYSVSHDLRAPLRAIDGFSQILLEDHRERLNEEGKRVLNVVRDNTQKMGQLVEDLLTFSHLGRKEIKRIRINMEKMSKDIFEELKVSNPQRKLEIKINALPPCFGDKSLIYEVLVNLLSNAIKFSKNGKSSVIEVGGKLEDNENIYYVKDNGVGFDMKYKDKLFGVFQRLHSQEDFKGTGVGLALVQRIIHRHGGRVWAEGKVGKGATFYFTLPLRKEKEQNEK